MKRRDELVALLRMVNSKRRDGVPEAEEMLDDALDRASQRLAVYGSLAPCESNHWLIEGLPGRWEEGRVSGVLEMQGWGVTEGFPGMIWVPDGDTIPVKLFTSAALPRFWERIDAFEGPDYIRQLVPVDGVSGGPVVANIYAVRQSGV